MLGSSGGFHAFRFEDADTAWVDVPDRRRFTRCCQGAVEVGAVPYGDESYQHHGDSAVLWARIESGASLALLRAFKPYPTLLLREGQTVRYTALWAVHKPLSPENVERANKRIAHALKTAKKWAHPKFMFQPAGSKGARSVEVAYQSAELYPVGRVIGRLADAPEPFDWRAERKRPAEAGQLA